MKPLLADAYQLMQDGAIALSEVEAAGIKIDVPYLEKTITETKAKIKELEHELMEFDEWKLQRKRFGLKASLGSRQQLGEVLFRVMGLAPPNQTASGRDAVDVDSLAAVGTPYTKKFTWVEKLKKLEGTYLRGVLRETVDSRLHPSFALHLATTYRSSSHDPNFQNFPVRDPEISKLIRSAFIPTDGDHRLVEIDFGALEFRGAACKWKDPKMVQYASDKDRDIHRDCAAEIFMLKPEQVSKLTRYAAKNKFVFPQIYGDYYVNNAVDCWDAINQLSLNVDGLSLFDHLAYRGIHSRGPCDHKTRPMSGTFEHHMKGVQNTFNEWFPVYSEAKEKWWKEYCERGWFDLMTGFRVAGVFKKNFVLNCVIQGPAFHLLLWSLIKLVQWLMRTKMRTKIVGQIHDSIVADVHKDELDDFVQKAKQVMTVDVRNHWDWVITSLEIEVESSATNWFEKEKYAI